MISFSDDALPTLIVLILYFLFPIAVVVVDWKFLKNGLSFYKIFLINIGFVILAFFSTVLGYIIFGDKIVGFLHQSMGYDFRLIVPIIYFLLIKLIYIQFFVDIDLLSKKKLMAWNVVAIIGTSVFLIIFHNYSEQLEEMLKSRIMSLLKS